MRTPGRHRHSNLANLTFAFGWDQDAEIRIARSVGDGDWSYLGPDALSVPRTQPTMNLGELTSTTPESEIRRAVLRQFGHVLGFVNENEPAQRGDTLEGQRRL